MEEDATPTVKQEKAQANTAPSQNNEKTEVNLPLIIIAIVLILAGLIYLFIRLGPETTGTIRDITLIVYVLESAVTVTALTVLCIQLARLVNFLKYEISPILRTTEKTVKKISGTVSFLSENAVEPVIDAASTVSGIKNAASGFLSLFRK